MSHSRHSLGILFFLAGVSLASAQGGGPATVRVDPVRLETVQNRRFVTGEIRAARHSSVAAREPGIVLDLLVREGQKVESGATLARLDDARLQIEKLQLEADRTVAAATLEERKSDIVLRQWQLDAFRALAERGSGYEKELREAEAGIAVAEARKTQAERQLDVIDAQLALVERRLADTVIVAPFSAVVVARRVEKGEWLAAGSPVADLVSIEEIEAWFEIPEELSKALGREGAEIEVRVEAADVVEVVRDFRVVPQVDVRARSFPVIVTLGDSSRVLKPGMSAQAWVQTSVQEPRLTISKDAVLRNEVGAYAYVARSTGEAGGYQAVPLSLEPLFAVGDRVVVRAPGLQEGDLAVIEGNERLLPRTPISVVEKPGAKGDG